MFFEIATIVAFVAWVTSGTGNSAPASVPNQLKAKGQAYKDHIKQADRIMSQARTIRASNSKNNGGNQKLRNLYASAADHAFKANVELSSVFTTLQGSIDKMQHKIDNSSGAERKKLIRKIEPARGAMAKLLARVKHAKRFTGDVNRRKRNLR